MKVHQRRRQLNRATYWPGWEPAHRVFILCLLRKRRLLWLYRQDDPEKWAELERRRSIFNS